MLADIVETHNIVKTEDGAAVETADGREDVDVESEVSMNMWGFTRSMMEELKDRFPKALEKGLKENPLKCEYFLPFVVDELIREDRAEVKVLTSRDRWYGVTYKEDKPTVVQAVRDMKERGLYPEKLWGPEEVER